MEGKTIKILLALAAVSVLLNIALLIGILVATVGKPSPELPDVMQAECVVAPNPSSSLDAAVAAKNQITGKVTLLENKGADLQISLQLTGFEAAAAVTKHGFHIHQKGDIVSNGCNSAGGHFNPLGKNHGDISSEERHVGDWGNIDVSADGTIDLSFSDKVAKLSGPYSILGRAIVIHQLQDDLGLGGNDGSKKTGNAGARLACCVIVAS